ncbi:MAG: acyl-protein synthetase [Oscillospiraceae bacterium]|nr:acyl-protein synthetase [Oscillospiraceae bacterium]
MKYRKQLFSSPDPFDTEHTDELFLEAVRENCAFQWKHCTPYREMLEKMQFSPDQLKKYGDLKHLPFLPTVLFKKHRLYSMRERSMLIKATSSGTAGKFSRIGFEASGLLCGLRMVIKIAKWRGLLSWRPTNYIILGYKPRKGNDMAVTKTAFGSTFFAPALHRAYALKYQNGKYEADLEGIIEKLQDYVHAGFPVRFMGFPSYTYFLLRMMDERGIHLTLPPHSKIMLGGGWKQFYTEQVDKEVLYALAKQVLGVEEENIIEFFGAAEHPILYCDCPEHHFHIPVYSRVIIRDVHTLAPVTNGNIGLVNLITPMVKATPILSIMTDDLGVLHDGEKCKCGLNSPYLEIIGRVGLRDIKTCAAGAAELLKGSVDGL